MVFSGLSLIGLTPRAIHLAALVVALSLSNALICLAARQSHSPQELSLAGKLVGSPAQDWHVKDWLNSPPLELKNLRGKVILVRWWMAGCPYCSATAPSLNEFDKEYSASGLQVVGFYHHKSATPLDMASVRQAAAHLDFKFPIAIDRNWETLRNWWLNQSDSKKDWTSVSFLIDRKGIIRYVHPGGQYVKGDGAYQTMKANIEQLLAEK